MHRSLELGTTEALYLLGGKKKKPPYFALSVAPGNHKGFLCSPPCLYELDYSGTS